MSSVAFLNWPALCLRILIAFGFAGSMLNGQSKDPLIFAGSTFAAPIYQKWIQSFEKQMPGLPLSYRAIGSEAGLASLEHKEVDFAASDSLPSTGPEKKHVYLIPTVVGGVVPAYNIPNLHRDLCFTPDLLANIYLGKINTWNDPAIRAVNRGAKLPAEKIVVVHRSDGSGTTVVWTNFLSKTSEEWRTNVGAGFRLSWPVGQGAQGNDGLADAIAKEPYSVGYLEFIYALRHQLSYGLVRNSAGKFISADIDSLSNAASSAQIETKDLSVLNAPDRDAYPIASFTWFVVPEAIDSAEKRERLKSFFTWMLSQGQRQVSALGYVPLPPNLVKQELERVQSFWPK